MDVVGVMAAYLPVARVYTASLDCAGHTRTHTHTHTMGKYAAITPTTSISTDTIEPLL